MREFYSQGDAEREKGVAVTPMFDREKPIPMPKFQMGFINFIVQVGGPSAHARGARGRAHARAHAAPIRNRAARGRGGLRVPRGRRREGDLLCSDRHAFYSGRFLP